MSVKKKHEENGNRDRKLRDSAEDQLARRSDGYLKLQSKNPEELIHELQVHQIELEMQNEELRRTQRDLEASRAQYFELYDLAPIGYFTLSEQGQILEVNLMAASLLGVARSALVKQPLTRFILPEDQDIYYWHRKLLFETGATQVCELRLVKKDGAQFWAHIKAAAAQDGESNAPVYRAVMSDITDRKRAEEELRQSLGNLRRTLEATVHAMAITVETRDPYTAGHQRRVAGLSRAIATQIDLSADRTDFIRIASTIHDVGKIAVPAEILSKPTKLSDIEFGLIKTHAQAGYDILKDIDFPWPVAEVILQHHERMNGSGYPNGLTGEHLLIESRILAVADVVEAISSHRPYRPALGIDAALNEISKNNGGLFDPGVVDACRRLFKEEGYKLE